MISSENQHLCHATNCETLVPRRMFMCKRHWFMLPKFMRDEVWDAYTPGQEETMDVSQRYFLVTRKAIRYIELKTHNLERLL